MSDPVGIGECDSCEFEAELKEYRSMRLVAGMPDKVKRLCHLCAATMTGGAVDYPNQYLDGRSGDVMKTICYVGNAIIAEIRKLKSDAS